MNPTIILQFDGTDGANTTADIIDSTKKNTCSAVSGSAQLDSAQAKFGATSLYCDGSGDYITFPDSDNFYLSADFTISFWIMFDNTARSTDGICGNWNSSTFYWNLDRLSASGLRFISKNNTDTVTLSEGTNGWTSDTWYHVAIVRSGNNWAMYRDGTAIATATQAHTARNVSGSFYIGRDGSTGYFQGWIDSFRIDKEALWTSNFTAPTEPLAYNTIELTIPDLSVSASSSSNTKVGEVTLPALSISATGKPLTEAHLTLPSVTALGGKIDRNGSVTMPALTIAAGASFITNDGEVYLTSIDVAGESRVTLIEADIAFSAITINATATFDYFEGDVTLPLFTIAEHRIGDGALIFPSLTVSGASGATLDVDISAIKAVASAVIGQIGQGTVSLTSLRALSYSASVGSISLSALSMESSGTPGNIGRLRGIINFSINGVASIERTIEGLVNIPGLIAASATTSGIVASVEFDLPVLSADAETLTGNLGDYERTLPKLTVRGEAFISSSGSADIDLSFLHLDSLASRTSRFSGYALEAR